jgi:hypothetical protein
VLAALTTILASALAAATPPAATGVAGTTVTAPAAASAPSPTPAGAAADCPGGAALAAALNAVMAGLVPSAQPAMPVALANGGHLGVTTSSEGDVRVDLVDAQGEVVLHRVLPAPPRGHAPDCPALAETIALIIDRYLHDVGYEVPPLPPPAPKPASPPPVPEEPPSAIAVAPPAAAPAPKALWRIGLGGGARVGDAGGLGGDGDLVLGLEPSATGVHGGVRLSAGYAPPTEARWADKTATLRRIPLRLGLYLAVPAGPGQLEPGIGLGADVFIVSVNGPGAASGYHSAPAGDLALGYAISLTGPLYLRILSRVALAVPYTFAALEVPQVWETPRVYGEAGVELGFAFR